MVFDNSDGRLVAGTSGATGDVSIRRVVGSKKDEHFLNGKSKSRADIQAMLEHAGFSRHNPYFIVEQGKVTDLSVMRDDARMELLKRVAGTDVYESRRKDSLKILSETERKRRGIAEVVAGIDERLAELEVEREELEQFRRLDTQRRALQYTLHQRQLEGAAADMAERDDQLAEARAALEEQQKALDVTRASAEEATRAQEEAEAEARSLRAAKDELLAAKAATDAAAVAAVERHRALQQDVEADNLSQEELAERVEQAEAAVRESEETLSSVLEPAVAKALERHGASSHALRAVRAKEELLLARQGRASQFKTAKQRDSWLRKEAASTAEAAEAHERRAEAARARDEELTAAAAAAAADAAKQLATAAAVAEEVGSELEPRLRALRADAQRAGAERGAAMADLSGIERERAAAEARQTEAEARLYRGVPAAVRVGLQEAARLVREEGLEGVFGPLGELLTYEPRLDVAVEEVAGRQLFNLVVRDERVAAHIVRHLQRLGKGRVTCMPLNRLRPRRVDGFNAVEHPDVTPLIGQMTFRTEVENAVAEVFGAILVCKDADVAGKYALPREAGGLGVDCVTPDGYRRNADGSVFGGYVDRAATRSQAERARREAGEAVAATELARDNARAAAVAMEQRLSKLRGAEVELAAAVREATSRAKQLRLDAEASRGRAADCAARAVELRSEAAEAAAAAGEGRVLAQALREEVGTAMSSGLDAGDKAELAACHKQAEKAAAAQLEATRGLEEARAAHAEVEIELKERLRPQVAYLRGQLSGSAGGTGGADVERRRLLLQEAAAGVEAARTRQADLSDRLEALEAELAERLEPAETARAEAERLRGEEQEQGEALKRLQAGSDTLWRQRAQASETRNECETKLRDLGTLPGEAMEGIRGVSRSEVMRRLKSVGTKLTKFSHVNKKALSQRETFSKQRQNLQARQAETDSGATDIQRTIRHLDTEKDKAILRTFRGVARHFRHVFAELVPRGAASMVLVADDSADADASAADRSLAAASSASASASLARERSVSRSREIASDSAELEELEGRIVAGVDDAVGEASPVKRGRGGRKAGRRGARRHRGDEDLDSDASSDDDDGQEEREEHESQELSVSASVASMTKRRSELDQYKGVAIKASFAEGEAPKRIELYSGGQKTMLAIALLLAIQRCDPAPFYLFDEVDQALDSTYRTALADVIKRQAAAAPAAEEDEEEAEEDGSAAAATASEAHKAQFLTISFRTEIIDSADKHFVVEPGFVTRLTAHSRSSALGVAERICEEEASRAKSAVAGEASSASARRSGTPGKVTSSPASSASAKAASKR